MASSPFSCERTNALDAFDRLRRIFLKTLKIRGSTMKHISFEQFEQVELRSGTVVSVEEFPRARKKALKVAVDFGPLGILQTSAQVTHHYTPQSLLGRAVIGCVNLGEKNIAGFTSQFLLVGCADENGAICLLKPEPHVPNGQKVH